MVTLSLTEEAQRTTESILCRLIPQGLNVIRVTLWNLHSSVVKKGTIKALRALRFTEKRCIAPCSES